jgi:hypothetical protein
MYLRFTILSTTKNMSPTLSIRSMASFPYCGGRYKRAPSDVSTGKKSIGVTSGDWGGHAIGPLCPTHRSGYVAFSHCQTSSPCWNHDLYLTAMGSTGITVSRKSQYRWEVSLSGSTCPRWFQPECWRRSGIYIHVCGWYEDYPLPRGDCCGRWTPSHVEHASSVHIMLCTMSLSAVCRCRSHSQIFINTGRSSGTDVRSTNAGLDATDRHEVFGGPSAGIVPILVRYRVSFSPLLVPQLQLWHIHWLAYV